MGRLKRPAEPVTLPSDAVRSLAPLPLDPTVTYKSAYEVYRAAEDVLRDHPVAQEAWAAARRQSRLDGPEDSSAILAAIHDRVVVVRRTVHAWLADQPTAADPPTPF